MFKLFAAFIALGMTIGAAVSVKGVVDDLLHELDDPALTTAFMVPPIRPTTANVVPDVLGEADRLVQVAEDHNVSGERLHALAQDAASACEGSSCVEIMISSWGPAWAERVMRGIDLGSNG